MEGEGAVMRVYRRMWERGGEKYKEWSVLRLLVRVLSIEDIMYGLRLEQFTIENSRNQLTFMVSPIKHII